MNIVIIIQIHHEVYSSLNNVDLSVDSSQSFKFKEALLGKTADAANNNSFVKNAKMFVLLKYLVFEDH